MIVLGMVLSLGYLSYNSSDPQDGVSTLLSTEKRQQSLVTAKPNLQATSKSDRVLFNQDKLVTENMMKTQLDNQAAYLGTNLFAKYVGEFDNTDYTSDAGYGQIKGKAALFRARNLPSPDSDSDPIGDRTEMHIDIENLNADAHYSAFLRDGSCATGGGSLYRFNAALSTDTALNELWIMMKSDSSGVASGTIYVKQYATLEAISITVHETSSVTDDAIACTDLRFHKSRILTRFSPTAGAGDNGYDDIRGNVALFRRESRGTLAQSWGVLGLDMAKSPLYKAYINSDRCANNDGGDKFKFNTALEESVDNMLMPFIHVTMDDGINSIGAGRWASEHLADDRALSYVIQDPTTGAAIACADFGFD